MTTVLLLGFSTTGKSSVLKLLEKKTTHINLIDTDKEISRNHDNNIYKIFLNEFEPEDPIERRRPLLFIEKAESNLIHQLTHNVSSTRIIAVGPFIPSREGFKYFVERVRPKIYYLETNAVSVYNGLMFRHYDQIKQGLNSFPQFGCWDLGVTKRYINGEYKLLDEQEAIANISSLLNIQNTYKLFADKTYFAPNLNSYCDQFDQGVTDNLIDNIINDIT